MSERPTLGKEIEITSRTTTEDVIGKYAYNERWNYGGIITDIDERSVSLDDGTWHPTRTGDCPYDSLYINGFKVYEPIKKEEDYI